MNFYQRAQTLNRRNLMSALITFAAMLLSGGCSTTPTLPELTDEPPTSVGRIQTMFALNGSKFDGFWDITASGEEYEKVNSDQPFVCPALNQTYRVIVSGGELQNALSEGFQDVMISETGEFSFDSQALKAIDSFRRYKLTGRFPDASADNVSTGTGTMLWRDSIFGTKGADCRADLSISRSMVNTYKTSGQTLLFDMQAWRGANRHHDQRLPGYVISQKPLHGSLDASQLKKGRLVYIPKDGYSGKDFIAISLWQSAVPFRIYRFYNLMVQ